ncbi:hypothetical protein [Paenibacillus sp. YN15]|uniref:hypothetical protein n=1 Tax=Paenibacillus sp. YN15 TaxID=1742774 RepID=UPI000DCC38FD|nr:hypothetical protein [Paenibacillus sp. YN15]RAU95711.1 hypothetical protein DQG13_21635 [Paenibacillus sp. YN15]
MNKRLWTKRLTLMILAIQLLLTGVPAAAADIPENPDTSSWHVWELPNDALALGSPIDASFLLDAPAGKHGYARAVGENIVFEDGTRARFWGVNIAMSASFLSQADAKRLADRIARSGFNIVRFHQMDYTPAPNIFSATANPSQTTALNGDQLQKLFYLMKLLKDKGIYYYVDLLTMRPALAGEVPQPGDVSNGWKAHALFDPTLLQLQKDYARQLLTTKSIYTNTTLAEDKALVFIDIQNENSLFTIDAGRITDSYYINQLKTKFSQWLRTKYSTEAALKTAWTESGKVGIQAGENMANNSVNIIGDGTVRIPDLYDNLNYSTQRKNDSYEFFFHTVRSHYIEMRDFLKVDLKVKALITGSSMGGYPSTAPASMYLNKELMDFTDRHVYMSHPSKYFTQGSKADNDSIITKGNNFFQQAAYKRVFNQPYILGEWQECLTNDFRAEGDLMMAAMASFQNWNPIQFQMTAEAMPTANPYIKSAFGTFVDPAHTAIQPAAAILFHRGDVQEAMDSYYYSYSKQDVLNPAKGFPSSNIYRYGKVGIMFSGFADYNAALSSTTALNKLQSKVTSGETVLSNQLKWQPNSFLINTPYTNAVAGMEPNQPKDFGFSIIQYTNPFAVISLNSLTRDTLQNTNRILLTAVARARNTGFMLNNNEIVAPGKSPVLYEGVSGTITLKTTANIQVYGLNTSGQRQGAVTVTTTAEGYKQFQIRGEYGRIYFEIVKN